MVENYTMNSYYIECFNLYFCEVYFCQVKSDAKDTKYLASRPWIYCKYKTQPQNNNVLRRVDTLRDIC